MGDASARGGLGMNILFGAAGALVIAGAAVSLRERGLQYFFAALTLMTAAWLSLLYIQVPGHEFATLLLLGTTASGMLRGKASRVLVLPIALLLPLAMISTQGNTFAVHDPWRAAGLVGMGAGVGLALRYMWSLAERAPKTWLRASAVSAWAIVVPGTILALGTPARGERAWNLLLPMVSLEGQSARVVALHSSSSRAWPWLEPLSFALPIAIGTIALVVIAAWFLKTSDKRVHPTAFGLAMLVLAAFYGTIFATAGAWSPLTDVDAQQVVQSVRPPFVPHDAVTYLTPDENSWQLSRPALALWLGLGGWLAASGLLIGHRPSNAPVMRDEHAALAPMMILISSLFFAESWSAQAIEVAAQRGTQGLIFALAALTAAAVLMRGRLRVAVCLLASASSAIWLAATLAQKVLS